jgi:hypothetical protein
MNEPDTEANLFAHKLLWLLAMIKSGASRSDLVEEITTQLTRLGWTPPDQSNLSANSSTVTR